MNVLAEATLIACFKLVRGEEINGLPAPVARYISGETDRLPDDIGWIPEDMRDVLPIMREIAADNRADRAKAKGAAA
ncbi:hypothetical protein [uncultured Azohydromonas sp.]|jgi:hypothetical protein|uniref:hypothetical protein n=1 Tax=uncultured Azohydromonas sp. TaxID=487342 RepID=UPI00260EC306|nr:hypothetical protein [uncultured Azohydromonas sp.]